RRPARELPPIPGSRAVSNLADYSRSVGLPPPGVVYADEFRKPGSRPGSRPSSPGPGAGQQDPTSKRVTARQSMWVATLDAAHTGGASSKDEENGKTFIQLDASETMTKAFTPHGLLQAGLQDKADRSAKEQERIAKETGASLINVPH